MNRYRNEYKYMISAFEKSILLLKAQGALRRDSHADEDGTYLIRSLYFDDDEDSCVQENENGTDPRSKFRIRYYNHDAGRIQLEKKSKKSGMTLKESCALTAEECRQLIQGQSLMGRQQDSEIKRRLLMEMQLRRLVPKVIVTYERTAFIYTAGNVRVTFDDQLSSSDEVDKFLSGDYRSRPVFPLGNSILEVKWDEVFPLHIREILQLDTLKWTAFSKYTMCRMCHL